MNSKQNPDQETLDRWHKDPNNWKFGLFYFNPKDKRIFPPKKFKAFGWTINFANPLSVFTLFFLIVIFIYLLTSK